MEAVIFVGIQAAGKSSFYKERFFNTHVRINLDMLKTRHRERVLLRACIDLKQPFVIDNTNPTAEERVRYIAPAKAAGFRIVVYYFQSRVPDCLARNARREPWERVPGKAIGGTARRLQLPSLAEGFDALHCVRIADDGCFRVEEWADEV
jgi:predicted kinase